MRRDSKALAVAAAAIAVALLAAACSNGPSGAGRPVRPADWSKMTSVAQGGGMKALIAAAKAEGHLNVIALPAGWANYGNIMKDFAKKYGIKIHDATPHGSNTDEINAMVRLKGQSQAPDVLDLGTAFAIKADRMHLLAPYKVVEWNDIPTLEKSADATWYGDYGGYIAIGYDSAKVKVAPTSFKDLLKPIYKHEVGINGNPAVSSGAFSAVYAAALANRGSFSNIRPGIAYFARLKQVGNFVPGTASTATIRNRTPIVIWWDYLLARRGGGPIPGLRIVSPTDASYSAYNNQAISASAPDPAAARLWEEYLYSVTGQNLWLAGVVRPVELPTMVANGTVDKAAYADLPRAPYSPLHFPTQAQESAARAVVARQWAAKVLLHPARHPHPRRPHGKH